VTSTLSSFIGERVVTPRKCERCGYHEMGITTEDGEYRALKKGMKIILIGG
jgi:hypothetical protein